MTQEIFAMEKMMYFFTNHGPAEEVVRSIWTGIEADHFMGKLKACDYSFSEFFYELSADNQEKFCQYILDNYHGMDSRKPADWSVIVELNGRNFDTTYFERCGITERPTLSAMLETIWHDESIQDFMMSSAQEGKRLHFHIRGKFSEVCGSFNYYPVMFHYFFDHGRIRDISEFISTCDGEVNGAMDLLTIKNDTFMPEQFCRIQLWGKPSDVYPTFYAVRKDYDGAAELASEIRSRLTKDGYEELSHEKRSHRGDWHEAWKFKKGVIPFELTIDNRSPLEYYNPHQWRGTKQRTGEEVIFYGPGPHSPKVYDNLNQALKAIGEMERNYLSNLLTK
ncbi:MAG: hypothetical protein K6F94_07325 [Bacteroidaceae bacterium]|nr:hypothetical protein [Bacteroidaceae bacterium]